MRRLHGPQYSTAERPQDVAWPWPRGSLVHNKSRSQACPRGGATCGRPPARPTTGSLSQMHSIRNLPATRFRDQCQEDGVEDMTQLE